MKQLLFLLCVVLSTSISFAQRGDDDKGDKRDKIKALMVTHISKDLDLSAQEAEKFWPVFHEANGRLEDLQHNKRKMIRDFQSKLTKLSDADAQKYISELDSMDSAIAKIEQNAKNDIIKILGPKRFLVLKNAEMTFKREMLQEFKERRERRGK